jgi:hypothetical protein
MNMGPAVIVKKGGFLSALAYGFFGTLTTIIICGSGLAFYGLHIVDSKSDTLVGLAQTAFESFPDIVKSLPPVFADALNDHRDPEYRDFLTTSVRIVPDKDDDRYRRIVVKVQNTGDKTVSLLSGHLVLEDADGVPIREFSTYVATPLAIEDEWRGPLFPGAKRQFSYRLKHPHPEQASLEISELRVWDGQQS